MNLVETRARVREDLQDTDALNYLWTDDQIDGAIERVVWEYSLAAPIEKQSDLATTLNKREIDISTLTGFISARSVEFPIGAFPPLYQRFHLWEDDLVMDSILGDGNDARIRWLQSHTLAAGSTTIPEAHAEIIVLGATGYLAMSASAYTVDRAAIAGLFASVNYRTWAGDRLDRYERGLKRVGRSSGLLSRELYSDE